MRVGVQREARAVVAQHAGQGLHVHAAGDRHGREGVSEVVEAHVLLDACAFQQLPVDPRHRVRVPSRFMRKFICRLRLNEVSRQ